MVVQAPEVTAAPATGFAVAGGRSVRMGRDKALLPWGESTLLDQTVRRLGAVCGSVRILCGSEPRYVDRGIPADVDLVRDAGALGGLLTGLSRLGSEPGLFLAVDLPFVPVELLRLLLERIGDHDAVVPVLPTGPEPLCAVYTRTCLEPVRRAISAGRLKMTSFWSEVTVREVALEELAAFGDTAAIFRNVNAPADYERARRKDG